MAAGRTIRGIQYLRGMAALLVVVSHCNGLMSYPEYFGASPFSIANFGGFGVAVFFVISGFIIVIVSLTPEGQTATSIGKFVSRRFRRIAPFMWVCIVSYNLFTLAGTGKVEWGPALRALALWPVGDLKPNVIWTLRHEFLFYTLFALTLLGRRRRPCLLALWFVAPLVVSTAAWLFPATFAGLHPWLQDLVNVLLCGRGANLQFGLGAILGLLWLQQRDAVLPMLPFGPWIPVAVTLAFVLLYQALTPVLDFNPVRTVPVAIIGPGEMLLVSAMAVISIWTGIVARPVEGAAHRLWNLLGDASFSIYLVHNAALLVFLELSRHVTIGLPPPLILLLFTVGAVLAGICVHWVAEKPLLRWLQAPARVRPTE